MIAATPPDVLFGELLSRPLHAPRSWKPRQPSKEELSLARGVEIEAGTQPFSGDELRLALEDFKTFLGSQSIAVHPEGVPLILKCLKGGPGGRFRIEVTAQAITLSADSVAGFRRALVELEDEMLGREGPFLSLGIRERQEVIRTRISRCFYGPIQRPPLNRNELADNINYYPDGYLNRLAHDGVTALWITIKFSESVPSRLFPSFGKHAALHLQKLRETVARCAPYGIKIYVFCIEPAALSLDSPLLSQHPELKGAQVGSLAAFCTQSAPGRRYLEEATETLFRTVPGLGGLIVIPVGERFTHCASRTIQDLDNCPRCSRRGRHKVLHDVLQGFRQGMDKAAPGAELIAWPYGQMVFWGAEEMVEAASHLPHGVILQHNYETGGTARQLGKPRPLWDYWLSWTGISPLFAASARRTLARKGRIAAKLQVGNSHENATVPFLPVPGLLYRKYRAMHELGVTGAMQSWYFGNFPSLMTRAAGLLSYAPLPENENAFLLQLARKEWGRQAAKVAKAWASFGRGYENYPATHLFSYYGPVQNGVTWPLYLKPRREPLSPTWQTGFPPSGDYLPHCFSHHFTLSELLSLCSRMTRHWQKGCRHLHAAYIKSAKTSEQTHEWRIAEAIRLQFETALTILRFYSLREELADTVQPAIRRTILAKMEALVFEEIDRRSQFIRLLREEPTLGYHSEAEDFKITEAGVLASICQLRSLLKEEFADVRQRIGSSSLEWFGDYTGTRPGTTPVLEIPRYDHITTESSAWQGTTTHPLKFWLFSGLPESVTIASSPSTHRSLFLPVDAGFRILADRKSLHFVVNLSAAPEIAEWHPSVVIEIEPTRMQPRVKFVLEASGACKGYYEDGYLPPNPEFSALWQTMEHETLAQLNIPLASLAMPRVLKPFRLNIRLLFANSVSGEIRELSWIRRTPMPSRLIWADIHPASDYGWARWPKPRSPFQGKPARTV